jgi:hypothetical protein
MYTVIARGLSRRTLRSNMTNLNRCSDAPLENYGIGCRAVPGFTNVAFKPTQAPRVQLCTRAALRAAVELK